MNREVAAPRGLKRSFVLHFIIDMLFGIPMMVAPVWTMSLFGWETVDPIMTRVVAAALFGIGIESWLVRDQPLAAFMGMLNLKILWSTAVVVGGTVSLLQGAQGAPLMGWGLIGVFVVFNVLWVYWWFEARKLLAD